MKTNLKSLVLISLIAGSIGSFAQNIVTVKNQFITSPVYDSYRFQAGVEVSNSDSLKKNCSEFHNILESYSGMPTDSIKKIFVSRRETTGEWQDFLETQFKIGIQIEALSLRDLLKNTDKLPLINAVSSLKRSEQLPMSVQMPMSVEVADFVRSKISLYTQSQSLSARAKEFGLEYSGILVKRVGSNYTVEVHGADLACDLIEGKAKLFFDTKAIVRPEVAAQDQIGQFYFELAKVVSKEINTTKTNRKKIVGITFGLAPILEEYGIKQLDKQNIFIGNLIDLVFVDDFLKMSTVWNINSDSELNINVQKMIDMDVKLELMIK